MALTKMIFSVKRTSTFGVLDFTINVGKEDGFKLLRRWISLEVAEENEWLQEITSIVVR
jgi:hypothetical protein